MDYYYGLLSEHFIKSENYVKGAEYSGKAARKSEKAAGVNNAVAYAGKRIFCLEKVTQMGRIGETTDRCLMTLGLYLVPMDYHVEAQRSRRSDDRLAGR